MSSDQAKPSPSAERASAGVFAGLRGEVRLRTAIDDLANQLCQAVDGNFDFSVRAAVEDETLEKLSMLVNFVLDTARRGMTALQRHNEALAELDLAKTVFFSNASHELRTPLTLILGPLEDALARPSPSLSGDALTSAHRNAVRLLKLVNALLDFSRIEGGRLQATFQPTELGQLTADLAGVFRAAIERAGLTLTVECAPLAEAVFVDRQMWEKIVLNLLSNAFKFTFKGGIRVSLAADGGHAVLTVADTGVGIPPAEQGRVFERFHRVEGTQARTHEGFGIGLAMIQELVRIHGGSISVKSELEQGSTFEVRVPLGREHLPRERVGSERNVSLGGDLAAPYVLEAESWETPQAGAAKAFAPASAREEPARLLIADDNADMREYVGRLLGRHWTVDAVADGEAALQAALAKPPDLIVSDIMMPRLDGCALVRALRADPRTASVPVILLSARAGEEAMIEGLDVGADDYVVKPFSALELVARVRTHLRLSRMRSDAAGIERIGALLNSKLELQDVVQILTDEATKLCGAQFGAFFYNVLDDRGESYMLYSLAGVPRETFSRFPMPRNTAIFHPTFSGQGVVRLDDVTKDPRFGKNPPFNGMPPGHLPVRGYLAVPVIARSGEVLGGLFFGHRETGVFGERSERLVAAVAHHAAIAIENAQLYKSERKARADAEAAGRSKDEFLAMLGHELRNPLAPIVTALEIMRLGGGDGGQREQAVIQRQIAHVVRLVDDLLDVSRIARGKLELKREHVEIAEVIAKAVEMVTPLIEMRRHRLELTVPAEGLGVDGDFIRLAQVVSNLLTNAAKFTDVGGSISITAARVADTVELRVRDSGVGIAAEHLADIFEMFTQGPQTLERSQGGLGLGLSIARNLVQLHGGSIHALSEGVGRGAEFVVRLPWHSRQATTGTGEDAGDQASAGNRAAQPLRILVVDDNQDSADMLVQALSLVGHEAQSAYDGPTALKAAIGFRPQIVLLDIGLPVMDGFEVARRLREIPQLATVRLFALTGYGQEADRLRSSEAGFDDHLVKPVDFEVLQSLLRKQAS